MRPTRRWAAAAALAAGLAGLTGCGRDGTADAVAAMNTSNAQRLANLYAAHQNFKGGRGPKAEADFKTYIREFDAAKLGMMGVDPANVDAVFTSDRDGQPLKVRYGVGGGRGSSDAVVFEQGGKDGKKQVAFTDGKLVEADDAEYKTLLAGKGER
ncbi:MAG: hypothetical protein K2X82_18665, partial [Gemmataceae bacterium]|nr:hypothetical protein [Gemmataceae bacterium]